MSPGRTFVPAAAPPGLAAPRERHRGRRPVRRGVLVPSGLAAPLERHRGRRPGRLLAPAWRGPCRSGGTRGGIRRARPPAHAAEGAAQGTLTEGSGECRTNRPPQRCEKGSRDFRRGCRNPQARACHTLRGRVDIPAVASRRPQLAALVRGRIDQGPSPQRRSASRERGAACDGDRRRRLGDALGGIRTRPKITAILDNAAYRKSRSAGEYAEVDLEPGKEAVLACLPPYTPQPNPAEIGTIRERLAGMHLDSAGALKDAIKAVVGGQGPPSSRTACCPEKTGCVAAGTRPQAAFLKAAPEAKTRACLARMPNQVAGSRRDHHHSNGKARRRSRQGGLLLAPTPEITGLLWHPLHIRRTGAGDRCRG